MSSQEVSTTQNTAPANRPEQRRERRVYQPPADIMETNDSYRVLVDLPGVSKDQLQVDVERNVLSLRGKPTTHYPEQAQRVHTEYAVGDFERSFRLPEEIDRDNIKASIANGVVTIELPKMQPNVKQIPVMAG